VTKASGSFGRAAMVPEILMHNNVIMGVIRGKVGVQLGSGSRFLGSQTAVGCKRHQ
jgi:hypothetical protein